MTFASDTPAIGWSATIGLIPGYGHDNDPDAVAARKALLAASWDQAMRDTADATDFVISAVMTDSVVLYPRSGGCPEGGERAVTLTGSSNPVYVGPDAFDDYVAAVERTVLRVQRAMEQTTVRIEFRLIQRSVYSRLDPSHVPN